MTLSAQCDAGLLQNVKVEGLSIQELFRIIGLAENIVQRSLNKTKIRKNVRRHGMPKAKNRDP
jgi:hypothetical protein